MKLSVMLNYAGDIKGTADEVSALEKAGILSVEGRWVTLADRDRLKAVACECYDIIRKTYEEVGA